MTMSTYFHRKHLKTNKNNICPLVPPSNWLSSLFEFYRKYTSLIHTSNYSWQKIFLCCFVAYHLRRIPKGARNQNRTFFLMLPYLVIKPWHKFSESADFPFLFFFSFCVTWSSAQCIPILKHWEHPWGEHCTATLRRGLPRVSLAIVAVSSNSCVETNERSCGTSHLWNLLGSHPENVTLGSILPFQAGKGRTLHRCTSANLPWL